MSIIKFKKFVIFSSLNDFQRFSHRNKIDKEEGRLNVKMGNLQAVRLRFILA